MIAMNPQQKIFRVRRNYNRWVANQTLEDYALRFTAKKSRHWTAAQVAQTALGAISFLALEAIGGAITLSYGFENTVAAVLVVGAIIFFSGIPITYYAAKQGTDIDLLTRGAGFGYIGSTITSLIYASFTFIFFALEAAILALALELTLGIPLSVGYVISALMVIPLVTHGITLISRFQVWTQPIWIVLQVIPLICIFINFEDALMLWTSYSPETVDAPTHPQSAQAVTGQFNLLAFGAASAVIFSLIAQIGEQVDFLRFLPKEEKPSKSWWFAMLAAGPGWIVIGGIKILIGSFLAVLALQHGYSLEDSADPNRMYLTAFNYVTSSPEFNLILLGVFVVISQLKINVTNAYAGSIAWSNFFSRLTHNHPGRVVWLIFNVFIALLLMELGIYRVLEEILGGYSIIALAWVGSIVADLTISKPLGLRPKEIEFKRAHLFDINPVGVGSMIIASVVGFVSYLGLWGEYFQALASFVALGTTFICAPLIAWLTKGKYYIARASNLESDEDVLQCCICEHHFEKEDMTYCPAYGGNICSLCCSLDSRCQDVCKTDSRFQDQLINGLSLLLPQSWVTLLNSRIGHFLGLFFLTGIIIVGVLALVYFQVSIEDSVFKESLGNALFNVFFILLMVFGVISWMFTLAHESRLVAQQESDNQTSLLMAEIEAHRKTDLELQKAKQQAEAANRAKSRYLTGISHELRSPLNAILGYAQLLEKDPSIPPRRQNALNVIRRSSEHLSDLIEGLLDISRIEAGRLEITKSNVAFGSLLDQLVSMFEVQAKAKGLNIIYKTLTPLPQSVRTDEKRLRQILINLLSNAVKYTREGEVVFTVRYRNQVAEFCIEDSGVGIPENELQRIFKPFERIRSANDPHITGTGLGLTITRFLIDVMGGELRVESTPGKGSKFRVSLMLPSAAPAKLSEPSRNIVGYYGPRQTIFIVDDDPDHRRLLTDALAPLGFSLVQASSGENCLDMIGHMQVPPKIFLLDISMPGMSGWELAQQLRLKVPDSCLILISANANINPPNGVNNHNCYLIKPFRIDELLHELALYGGIKWCYGDDISMHSVTDDPEIVAEDEISEAVDSVDEKSLVRARTATLDQSCRAELIALAKIGYVSAIQERLNREINLYQSKENVIGVETPADIGFVDRNKAIGDKAEILGELHLLQQMAGSYQLSALITRLEGN